MLWLLLLRLAAAEIALGAVGAWTRFPSDLCALLAANLDFQKNFDADLRERLGPPIIPLPGGVAQNLTNLTVSLHVENSEMKPDVAMGKLLMMLQDEGAVVGLIGGSASPVTIPLATVAATRKIVQISGSSTSLELSNKEAYPYFLRTLPPDNLQAAALWSWILEFQVPAAICMYTTDGYGQALFDEMKSLALNQSQPERLLSQALRSTSLPAPVAEELLRSTKQLGSRFLILCVNAVITPILLGHMEDQGMLAGAYQVVAADSALTAHNFKLPVGCMVMGFVNQGALYPKFKRLLSQMRPVEVIDAAKSQMGVELSLDAVANVLAQATELPPYAAFWFDAVYSFLIAINSLKRRLPDEMIAGDVLLSELQGSRFEGVSGDVSFDENGDRLASYELLNVQPESQVVLAIFHVSTRSFEWKGNITWMDGTQDRFPPRHLVSCPPGFYKQEPATPCKKCPRGAMCMGGNESFSNCPRGSYSSELGSTNCTPCAVGHFAPDVASIRCSPCSAGYEGPEEGMEECQRCPIGRFMPRKGSQACWPCQFNQVTNESGAKDESECHCDVGHFMCEGCQPCLAGLRCLGHEDPVQLPGFWASASGCQLRVLRCRDGRQCPETSLGGCAAGRQGRACNDCKIYHTPLDNGTCERCRETDVIPVVILILMTPLVLALLSWLSVDLGQQSLNLLTAAAVTSQMLMVIQALGSIRSLSIVWPEPVKRLMDLTRLFTLNLDIVRVNCVYGTNSAIVKFASSLLICPLGLLCIMLNGIIGSFCRKRSKYTVDSCVNLCGLLLFAFFLSITLTALHPFQCRPNPDGTSSMVSEPGIECFGSEEHTLMVLLGTAGILSQSVVVVCWITYATLMYPARVASGRGLRVVSRYRFLFHRLKPQCYYYGLVLLYRNALVAIFPVILVELPQLQLPLMGGTLLASAILQSRIFPWRTEWANVAELMLTSFLLVILFGAAPLLETDVNSSMEFLGWLLCVPVLGLALVGLVSIIWPLANQLNRQKRFDIFLCHHKAGAGSLCRLMKLLFARHSSIKVFLDCDQLENLDFLFDVVRSQTKTVVVVQTPELFKRIWCGGEITTAHKNNVPTLTLVCDGFHCLTEEQLAALPAFWGPEQHQMLASYDISVADVLKAYAWLQKFLIPLELPRFGHVQNREEVVVELLSRLRSPSKLRHSFVERGDRLILGRILITSSVGDAESLSTCEVFQILLQAQLQVECLVVQGSRQMLSWKPWAYYFVVLLFRGMFRDPGFVRILLAAFDGPGRDLDVVTIVADPHFDFPTVEVYEEFPDGEEEESKSRQIALQKAVRRLLNVVALPFSPQASDGLQKKQVVDIAQRFHRYKDLAAGTAKDLSDDLMISGDIASPGDILGSAVPNAFCRSPYMLQADSLQDQVLTPTHSTDTLAL